jgi:hypothetical protein
MKTNAAIDLSVTKEVPSDAEIDKLLNNGGHYGMPSFEKLGGACIQQDTWN